MMPKPEISRNERVVYLLLGDLIILNPTSQSQAQS